MNAPAEARYVSTVAALWPGVRAGLVGRGIRESRTPRMHEIEGERLGLRYRYELFDFDCLGLADSDLEQTVQKAGREGYAGLNVTHPFKEQVVAYLDRLSPDAAAIGAVNTITFRDGAAVGHNTDCWGFAESFQRGFDAPQLNEVVLVGAGGAGMAVAKALLGLGVRRLAVFDAENAKTTRLIEGLQVPDRAQQLADVSDLKKALARADGLVNATPVGMAKYPGIPIDRQWLRPALWVADIIYFPAETELLRAARAAGCRTLPGAGMAIFQAVKAFELITGVAPDAEQMARHFQTMS